MSTPIRGKRLAPLAAMIGAVGLIAAGVAYAQLAQIAVLTGAPDQETPSAEGNMLAWARNGPTNKGPFNAYLRVGNEPIRQVNAPGTQGFPGGFSGDRLIFQQVGKGGQSDMRFYNAVTHAYGALPSNWNSSLWEWSPSISGRYVLFGREGNNLNMILLGDLTTGRLTPVARESGADSYAGPGQVNGNYATWMTCTDFNVSCDVYEYNIATAKTSKVSDTFSSGKFDESPSVSKTGTVYFWHSGLACGSSVTLNKRPLGGTRTTLLSLAHGLDVSDSYVDDSSGTPVVYYERLNCAQRQDDIYKAVD